jgi:hypothetical protein
MRCEAVDLAPAIRALPRGYASLFSALIEQRASGALPDERFVDLRYRDLVADPLAAVESLYARLGWRLGAATKAAMAEHLARRPRHARGAHAYTLESFGLDAAAERERFRPYCERFGVPAED